MAFQGFDQRFFAFYEDLAQNNERGWFLENKHVYENAVVTPTLAFITEMGPRLAEISEHLLAIPKRTGGSLFRIYRDTRFSKDKTPYKTHAAVQFRHRLGKDVHAPGFYFHVSTREFILGMGIWHPDSASLAKIRQAIDEKSKDWVSVRDKRKFREHFSWAGESLKRAPKGFPVDHPLIEDLKRKDFIALDSLPPPDLLRPDLVDLVSSRFAVCKAPMAFLCRALGVPF